MLLVVRAFALVLVVLAVGCATCDDLAARERDIVQSASSCEVDTDCRIVAADGCHVLCSISISTDADSAAVTAALADVRSDAQAIGCSCPVADCIAPTDLTPRCVDRACTFR